MDRFGKLLFETSDLEGLLDIVEKIRKSPLVEYVEPHMVGQGAVSSLSSVSFIDTLPEDKHALHDIRFIVNNI